MALKGGAELRRKLLEMQKGLGAAFLTPMVNGAAQDLRAAEIRLAPKGATGKLAGGIAVEIIKAGTGYAYALVSPQAEQYYGMFQEYGLGTGRSAPLQEKTLRRRGNYEASLAIRKKIFVGGGIVDTTGLSKGEKKRQLILAQGGYLQGKRRPNMAAQPFARPAVTWRWPYIRQYWTDRLRELVEKLAKAA